jgi:hypothetical protein
MVEGAGSSGYTLPRRGGRVVECGGLENRYVGNPGVGGSNPPLSACQHVPPCGLNLSARFGPCRPSLVSMSACASQAVADKASGEASAVLTSRRRRRAEVLKRV